MVPSVEPSPRTSFVAEERGVEPWDATMLVSAKAWPESASLAASEKIAGSSFTISSTP